MKKLQIRKVLTSVLVMALMLVGTAVPALAVASGSATIKSGADLVSGLDDQKIVFTVTNTATNTNGGLPVVGSTATDVDLVQFVPPADLFKKPQGQTEFSAADFKGPDGWTPYVQSDVIRFVADDGKELGAGDSAEFTLEFDVKGQPADTDDFFFVSVSDDRGMTLTTAGVLGVNVRTLQVVANLIDVVKPTIADVTDGTKVTEQQTNATVSVTVVNRGSQAQSVTPRVSRKSGTSSITVGSVDAKSIGAGLTESFTVPATFGAAGDLVLQADATSTQGSTAPLAIATKTITVQPRIDLDYVADSLSPKFVNPLSTPSPTFTLQVNKVGGPATLAALPKLESTLKIGSVTKKSNDSFAAGNVSGQTLTFSNVGVSTLVDDLYGATLSYSGTDANGAAIAPETLNLGNVLIDRLNAIVEVTLTPPASAVASQPRAASFSDSITVGGNVTRGANACTDCRVNSATVTMNGRSFPAATDITISAAGAISGSITMPGGSPENLGSYQAGDSSLKLTLGVKRVIGGVETPQVGAGDATAPVDIVRPDLKAPVGPASGPKTGTVTGRDAEGDYVDVIFTEKVNFGQFASAADWLVDGATVSEVRYVGQGNERADTDRVRLRLLEELPNDAAPVATYNPRNPLGRPGYDRVELRFTVPDAVDVADGIAPDALNLAAVSTYREGLADNSANAVFQGGLTEDGKQVFVTRDNTPVARIADVLPGNTVTVFVDTNRDGVQNAGEATLGGGTNNGTATQGLDITLNVGSVERDIPLGVYATDTNRNRGVSLTTFTLRVDATQITIEDFARTGQNVTVTLSENVTTLEGYAGRDAAIDWFVQAGGRWRPVETVSNADGAANTRTLNVNSMVVPANVEITGVRYEFVSFGPEPLDSERYLDRALNEIADGAFTR